VRQPQQQPWSAAQTVATHPQPHPQPPARRRQNQVPRHSLTLTRITHTYTIIHGDGKDCYTRDSV